MQREMSINGRLINDDEPCYVIAEIGHNHQGEIEQAFKLIDQAVEVGADAVKTQKRDNKNLFTKAFYNRAYDNPNSFGETYGEHREFLEFDEDKFRVTAEYAKDKGMSFFCTAFDEASADFLEEICDPPAYKIASGDLRNTPLIDYVARLGKPMVVSTGGGDIEDVKRAVEAVVKHHDQLAVLQCTMSYPTPPELVNLRVIQTLREELPGIVVGFSDHYNGIAMAEAAYLLGARVIEKHMTLDHTMKGTDHALSLEKIGMQKMIRDLNRTREAMGTGIKQVLPEEEKAIEKMGKGLVAVRDLPAGHVLTAEDLTAKSPGGKGLPPSRLHCVLGQTLKIAVDADELITEEVLREELPDAPKASNLREQLAAMRQSQAAATAG